MSTFCRTLSYSAFWLFLALVVGFMFARYTYDVQGGLLVFLALFPIAFLLIKAMASGEARWFPTFLAAALVLKLAVAMFRMSFNIVEYGGLYDAGRYHQAGTKIAEDLWRLDLLAVLPKLQFGTVFTEFYSGLVHAVIGPTVVGAYLVFSLLAFVGSFFFYRAFCIAFPNGDRRLYAVVLFLLPSLLYWPNGLGKDALMALFIGLTAYGAAKALMESYIKGLLPLSAGLLGSMTVRPHMAGILALALAVTFLLGARRSVARSPLAYLLGLAVIAVAIWLLVPMGMKYAGLEQANAESIVEYIELRQRQTLSGGSAFTPPSLSDPASVVATVLLRPFPWEAHNFQAFIQASDGMLLLALVVWKMRRLGQAIWAVPNTPFLLFILVYTLLFFPAFTTISNFGTLARERAMLLPLFLMLLAFRPPPKKDPAANLVTV